MSGLLDNSAFRPGRGALPAPPFEATVRIAQTAMHFEPQLAVTQVGGRDTRVLPRSRLDFVTLDEVLVPVRWGQILPEEGGPSPASHPGPASYWSLIPQLGRLWRDPGDDSGWSWAAFPLMLVNDQENHAHQGLARFRYRGSEVRDFQFQFVQQTAPYLVKPLFLAWGAASVESGLLSMSVEEKAAARAAARRELAARLPSRPWSDLVAEVGAGVANELGGGLEPEWVVIRAWVRPERGPSASSSVTLYYTESATARGPYPYPLEMRFGVRSIMKSIGAPLALLHLAAVYGSDVLSVKVGQYVSGLHEKFNEVRLIDAANMATGFGGTGSSRTQPNDIEDGYLEADYDGWYTAPSHQQKIAHMAQWLKPYPWAPGAVLRYRDQDFYVLGAALDGFLKSVRGPQADIWDMLMSEVFAPIGIYAAPTTRTREPSGARGQVWLNAGYFPTLDDLAKISLLYQTHGTWAGQRILHRDLTAQLLGGQGALSKRDGSVLTAMTPMGEIAAGSARTQATHYRMGFHFTPGHDPMLRERVYLPTMWGAGEGEVRLYPSGQSSIRIGKLYRP